MPLGSPLTAQGLDANSLTQLASDCPGRDDAGVWRGALLDVLVAGVGHGAVAVAAEVPAPDEVGGSVEGVGAELVPAAGEGGGPADECGTSVDAVWVRGAAAAATEDEEGGGGVDEDGRGAAGTGR